MNKALFTGMGFGIVLLASCGAAKWVEPHSWTLRPDLRIRHSGRKEDFDFKGWSAKYLKTTGNAEYGILITPAGAKEIADELSRRNATIIELRNKLSECD